MSDFLSDAYDPFGVPFAPPFATRGLSASPTDEIRQTAMLAISTVGFPASRRSCSTRTPEDGGTRTR